MIIMLHNKKDIDKRVIDIIPEYLQKVIFEMNGRVLKQINQDILYISPTLSLSSEDVKTIVYSVIIRDYIYTYLYSGEKIIYNNDLFQIQIDNGNIYIKINDNINYKYLINRTKLYINSMLKKGGIYPIYGVTFNHLDEIQELVTTV